MKDNIKVIVMDVDGTLTDGGIYIAETGELMKRFSVKDGYAIGSLLPKYNIIPAIITGRKSQIVENRAKELGIKYLIQGSRDKCDDLKKLAAELDVDLLNIAYIGDDNNDIDAMKMVGLRGCPADASTDVKEICEYVSCHNGGNGAVREIIELLIKDEVGHE